MTPTTTEPTPLRTAVPTRAPAELLRLADEHREAYARAEPFAHVALDGFFSDEALLARVLDELPPDEHPAWKRHRHQHSAKLALADPTACGEAALAILSWCNTGPFVEFLERLTGIEGLIPDPHWLGGGAHRIRRGGFLDVHADFNRHDRLRLDRRLNLLIYLNRDWDDAWGGGLELWDEGMTGPVRRISPRFNRIVVFSTTDRSFHGHPDPLTCPPERARTSLALYYYTNGRPEGEASESHTTIYRDRPGGRRGSGVKGVLRDWLPPAIVRLLRRTG